MSLLGFASTVLPPTLKGVARPELIELEVEYRVHQEKIAEVNRSRESARRIRHASVRNCVDLALSRSLCMLEQIEGASALEKASDRSVRKWFDERLALATRYMAERIHSGIDFARFPTFQINPFGAVLRYRRDVVATLDINNASSVVKDKDMCKSLIEKILGKLEPLELRERIGDFQASQTTEQKADLSHYQATASALALDNSCAEIARARLKHRTSRSGLRFMKNSETMSRTRNEKRHKEGSSVNQRHQGSSSLRCDNPCLNSDRPDKHPIKDCKITPKERKKQLVQEYWSAGRHAGNNLKATQPALQEMA